MIERRVGSDTHELPRADLDDGDAAIVMEVGDDVVEVHAVELHGDERDAKYATQAERYPGFAEYERKTTRTIPVLALIPSNA